MCAENELKFDDSFIQGGQEREAKRTRKFPAITSRCPRISWITGVEVTQKGRGFSWGANCSRSEPAIRIAATLMVYFPRSFCASCNSQQRFKSLILRNRSGKRNFFFQAERKTKHCALIRFPDSNDTRKKQHFFHCNEQYVNTIEQHVTLMYVMWLAVRILKSNCAFADS